ncbi:MAG: efflux RND transporter permease subunit [Oceanospirillaceae bacterium]|nr:efflux RND transporter permease subunit [Oceanospirillaceae bacterium]
MRVPNLSAWAITNEPLVRYLFVLLLLLGVVAYGQLGQSENPKFTFRTMVVKVLWPGATAKEVEQQLTDKLEKKLQELPHLEHLRSYSKQGESFIYVDLAGATPPELMPQLWYQVRKKIGDLSGQLPQGIVGPFFNDEFGDTFGSIYAFTSDGFTHAQVREYVKAIRHELLAVPAVNKVQLIGVVPEKIYMEWDNAKLSSLNISPAAIIQALQTQNSVLPAGVFETDNEKVYVRVSGEFTSVQSIENTLVDYRGRSLRIGDIARVYAGYEDPAEQTMRFDGQDAIGLAISMQDGGDVIKLGKALDEAMARITEDLPLGIDVHQVSNQPRVVEDSIKEFVKVLIEAVVIVLLVSFFSLGFRTGLVVAISIPLVLAITFLLMKFFGIELQRISLGALIIALGLLVDDAMIAVEMMVIKLEQGWTRFKAATFAFESTAFPMLTGTLITAAGFLPVGAAKSAAGEYTFSLFAVVVIALLVSWVVAVIFTPYIGYKILPKFSHGHGDETHVYQTPFYQKLRSWVGWCVENRKTVIAATVATFVLSVVCFKFVDKQFFPDSNRVELLVDLTLQNSASLEATREQALAFEKLLQNDEDIVNYTTYVGVGSSRFYLSLNQKLPNNNFSQIVIMTKDPKARERVRHRLISELDENFPLVRGRVSRLENGPPIGYPVQFRISGRDIDEVKRQALAVADIVRLNPNTKDVNLDWDEESPIIQVEVNEEKAKAMGVTVQQVKQSLHAYLSGSVVSEFRDGDELVQVVARVAKQDRERLEALGSFGIQTSSQEFVPLSQLARLHFAYEQGVIWRYDSMPTITVLADVVDGNQAPSVSAEIDPELNALREKLPMGYKIAMGGAIEKSAESREPIKAVMPWVLVITLTLLMLQLKSFQRSVLVLLTAPLGIIGMTWFLLLLDSPFGFVAMLGGISLAGMIMRNSVILVDQIEQDVRDGLSLYDAIIESTVRRFRPIILTAAAAILAMIPLTSSIFWGPLAVVIMGGLLGATVLTLFFLPALYAAWFRAKRA